MRRSHIYSLCRVHVDGAVKGYRPSIVGNACGVTDNSAVQGQAKGSGKTCDGGGSGWRRSRSGARCECIDASVMTYFRS